MTADELYDWNPEVTAQVDYDNWMAEQEAWAEEQSALQEQDDSKNNSTDSKKP